MPKVAKVAKDSRDDGADKQWEPGEEFAAWDEDFQKELRLFVANVERYHRSIYTHNQNRRMMFIKRFE